MKKFLLGLLVLFAITAASIVWYVSRFVGGEDTPLLVKETTRTISSGSVVGFKDDDVNVWLGIAYASAPVGDLRWRAPRSPESWEETRATLSYGSECPQNMISLSLQEDCLFLNVWSPESSSLDRPVMFFIHGGGNHLGSADAGGLYDGKRFASKYGIVLVTINYRLGPLGWFSHPALAVEGEDDWAKKDNSGNYGTLDILKALQWVQENVGAFGGDPNNVTIFGESAGGFNVMSMMVSPLAKGLYHKAIVQSGGMRLVSMSKAQNYAAEDFDAENQGHALSSRELTNRLLIRDGTAVSRKDAVSVQQLMDDQDLASYLRKQSAESILSIQRPDENTDRVTEQVNAPDPFLLWSATDLLSPFLFGDGYVLPADVQVRELLSDPDGYNQTPIILGSNRDEAKLFMMGDPYFTHRIFGLPFVTRNEEAYGRATSYGSLFWKADAVDESAIRLVESQGETVYAYRFDWDDLRAFLTLDLSHLLGASHALELPFVFGNLNLLETALVLADVDSARELSDQMMSYWAEFAFTGKPGKGVKGELAEWGAWTNLANEPRLMVFDSDLNEGSGLRMSSEMVTYESLSDRLSIDEHLNSDSKCNLASMMFDSELSDKACN